jgi:hypothetical protein
MTLQDKVWIEKCKEDWDYTIMVDNDEIFVVDYRKDRVVHTFSQYGYEFIKELLQYIGCDADYV